MTHRPTILFIKHGDAYKTPEIWVITKVLFPVQVIVRANADLAL